MMSQRFIESICCQSGHYENLELHQARVDRTFKEFFQGAIPHQLSDILPKIELAGKVKVRLVYDAHLTTIEFAPYQPKHIETIEVVRSIPFDYQFKYDERSMFTRLSATSTADEIIISLDSRITDSSYSNLVFWDGRQWLTPENPLLNGVRRESLLMNDKIKTAPIYEADIASFERVCLINAMLDLEAVVLPTSVIVSKL